MNCLKPIRHLSARALKPRYFSSNLMRKNTTQHELLKKQNDRYEALLKDHRKLLGEMNTYEKQNIAVEVSSNVGFYSVLGLFIYMLYH